MTKQFRTRQAPSPTGYLHLGTARQMLFTNLFAKKNDGVWYVRLEDTDRSRLQPDSVKNLLEAMQGLNLTPDEGITLEKTETHNDFYDIYQKGNHGPYIQSERLIHYHKAAQKLINEKKAYWSFLTPEDKEELQNFKKITKAPIDYLKANQDKYPENNLHLKVAEGLAHENKPALMFHLQRSETIECFDELLGKSSFDLSLEEDFVILKSDGFPTYHLGFAVDDHLMETSLIIRAQEWYPSLPKHVTILQDLWGTGHGIKFIHLPVILGQTGNRKMSKRDGNVNMTDYQDQGYLPEAIINYLAFLGWNPGTEKELYLSKEELNSIDSKEVRIQKLIENIVPEFNMENISKSSARFNLEKLNWFNREYIKSMNSETFTLEVDGYISYLQTNKSETNDTILSSINENLGEFKETNDPENIKLAFMLDQNRITTLSEIGSDSKCILNWREPSQEDLKWKKITIEESLANLKEIGDYISSTWDTVKLPEDRSKLEYITKAAKIWEDHLKSWLNENNKGIGDYLWPLRVCLSGLKRSPSPFEILVILNQEETIKRIDLCIKNKAS